MGIASRPLRGSAGMEREDRMQAALTLGDRALSSRLILGTGKYANTDVMLEAMRWAGMIASKSPVAMRLGKEAFHRQVELPLAEAYDHAARVMVENMMAQDAVEGIAAFLEKRQPHWGKQ